MNNNKIKIMPLGLANRIAAGEVVNRPESVVKELLENSIDAGATEITLRIKEAGKTFIQVSDNGSGMSEEDAVISFHRHSTSKIYDYDDLENIRTLGFRGEALASICSIAKLELKTKTLEEQLGTFLRIEGDELVENTKVNFNKGTSITVKNLFYNVPGRRNFLKSNQTEFRHIYDTFIRLAISHPEINFIFVNNDEEIFNLKQTFLIKRIKEIFSENIEGSLIPVDFGNEIINVKGLISKPNFTKRTKQDQFYYLNNRFFTSKSLNFAVYTGYDHLIEKGDYPSFFLFLTIAPNKIDVNVHPTKMEVKFEDENAVFGFIRSAVKDALRKADITFEIGFDNKIGLDKDTESFSYKTGGDKLTFSTQKPLAKISDLEDFYKLSSGTGKDDFDVTKPIDELPEKQPQIFEHKKQSDNEAFKVWQFQNKYIMCQTATGLMIIDQHAAHERVLYEKAILVLESQSSFSQQLLMPINHKCTKIDFELVKVLRDDLQNLGFNFNLSENDTVQIIGIPSDVKIGDENKIFQELLDQFKEYEQTLHLEKRDNLAKSFACRSAIKTGDPLKQSEMLFLFDSLFACKMPYVCPHGRPTVIRINTDELDKRFSRTN